MDGDHYSSPSVVVFVDNAPELNRANSPASKPPLVHFELLETSRGILARTTDSFGDIAEQYAGGEAAIEATGHYRPIYDRLDEHLDVTLVDPGQNRVIAEASVKTDRIDAKRLAHMLRADMLVESYVPGEDIRMLRDLVRTRKALVEERTAEKNRVRAVLKRTDNAYDSALFGPTGREYLSELSLSEIDRLIVEAHLAVIEEYDAQIERLELRSKLKC
jgi:transposase